MSLSPRRKVLVMSLVMFTPVAICWGIGWSLHRSEMTEFASGRDTTAVVAGVDENRVRFDGRHSEDITEVQVTFTPEGAAGSITAPVVVWSASGLSVGTSVSVRYLPSDPKKVQLHAGFWNRSSGVVFLTLFGAFWLVLDVLLSAVLWVAVGRLERRRAA